MPGFLVKLTGLSYKSTEAGIQVPLELIIPVCRFELCDGVSNDRNICGIGHCNVHLLAVVPCVIYQHVIVCLTSVRDLKDGGCLEQLYFRYDVAFGGHCKRAIPEKTESLEYRCRRCRASLMCFDEDYSSDFFALSCHVFRRNVTFLLKVDGKFPADEMKRTMSCNDIRVALTHLKNIARNELILYFLEMSMMSKTAMT